MRKRPCLLFACIFLTGIAFWKYKWGILCVIPMYFLCVEVYFGISTKHLKRMAGRSILLLSVFFVGMIHMHMQETFRENYMSKLNDGDNAIVFGEILKIEETEYGVRLLLDNCYIRLSEENIACNKIMVYASSNQWEIGQIYQIKGEVHLFEHARNEGNFDSFVFYQSQKIDFCMYETTSVQLGVSENPIRDKILLWKKQIQEVFLEHMPEDAAGFYMGMITGDKSLISDETKELFAAVGISHILAISGLHMSIIGRGCYKMLRKGGASFWSAGIFGAILLTAYCYMTGNGTSAIRAVTMMFVYFLAQYFGRSYDMLNALGIAILYLLWENPFLIEYSGFWFSVTALIGVGFVGKTLGTKLWVSIGITLASLPMTAFCYYEVPLYSPLVNSLVLPMLTPIFVLALVAALIGFRIAFLGKLLLIPCSLLFSFYQGIAKWVKELPYAVWITGKPTLEWIVVYYVVLIVGCYLIKCWTYKEKPVFFRKCMLSLCCFLLLFFPKTKQMEVIFLDVGQGDGIYIGSADGTSMFIDGGSTDEIQVGKYRILPFLKAHGIKWIEYWFLSHADADHISGFLEVLEAGYTVKYLVISNEMPKDEAWEEIRLAVAKTQTKVIQMKAKDKIATDSFCISCLYPWEEGTDRNEQSMVLLFESLDGDGEVLFSGLFTGDISSTGEKKLILEGVVQTVQIYKVAHHGSKYSNSYEFLEQIKPAYSVISCGANNRYGHPHEEAVSHIEEIGSEVLYTMDNGQITMWYEDGELKIKEMLP